MPTNKEKERRAKDEDKAVERAFAKGTLPEEDRREAGSPEVELPKPPAVDRATEPLMVVTSSEPTPETTDDPLMALPVGSIVERVDGGVHVKRRDGNGFKSGYGKTIEEANRDIRGLLPEEQKLLDEQEKANRERQNKAPQRPDIPAERDPLAKTSAAVTQAEERAKKK